MSLQRLRRIIKTLILGKQCNEYLKLQEDYEVLSIQHFMFNFHDIPVAAKMLRRLFPMGEEESVELITEFTIRGKE